MRQANFPSFPASTGAFSRGPATACFSTQKTEEILRSATLIDGPTIDFNVMVRRGRCTAEVRRYESEALISRGAQQAFFIGAQGSFRLHFPFDGEYVIRTGESLPVCCLTEGTKIIPDAAGASMVIVLIDLLEPLATATD